MIYQEKQKFDQWWLHLLFFIIGGIMLYGSVQQLLYGIPFGDNPAPNGVLIASDLLLVLIFILFRIMFLETKIDSHAVHVRLYPFNSKFNAIAWADITKHEVITYKPIIEFGGWGIRYNLKGKAYNIKGNEALRLTLKTGKLITIGTQNPDGINSWLNENKNLLAMS